MIREEVAKLALNDLLKFLRESGDVAIFDGTNSTKQRRKTIVEIL
jgi:predicted kinase